MKAFYLFLTLAAGVPAVGSVAATPSMPPPFPAVPGDAIPDSRPAVADRLFRSEAVERCIERVSADITDPMLRRMFAQCLPNTLDTTVHPGRTADGADDTFVVTGDITAMWLRDSGAQVWPYLRFCRRGRQPAPPHRWCAPEAVPQSRARPLRQCLPR